MSVYEAEKEFKAAAQGLRAAENQGLWHMNAGLLKLCGTIKRIESHLADLDSKIVHVSQQIGSR